MSDIRWQWLEGTADLSAAYAVRLEVFCEEQGYRPEEELDDADKTARHVIAFDGSVPVATGRLYTRGPGVIGLGRIAVRRSHRGTGLGARLVAEMLRKARELGARQAELDAQCRVIPFYEKQGFAVCGEEHMDGRVPHREMRMELDAFDG